MPSLRPFVAAACTVVTVACGGDDQPSPTATAPTPAPAILTPGQYTFAAVGGPTCVTRGISGTVGVRVRVTASKDGTNWTLRPVDGSDGDVVIRLVERPGALGPVVEGPASGTALDRSGLRARGIVSLTFAGASGGAAAVSGGLFNVDAGTGLLAGGQARGSFVETREGGTATCEQVVWSVER